MKKLTRRVNRVIPVLERYVWEVIGLLLSDPIRSKFGFITVIGVWITVKKGINTIYMQYIMFLLEFIKKEGKVSFTIIL